MGIAAITDRQKVSAWLAFIREVNPQMIEEVMALCSKDPDARRYFVMRYNQDINQQRKDF